ncbi:hypothetical protein [Nonomuraea sp. NPDC050202]|uniref:hypothetical protein n=1 Tax=Nonomuraea sp. NPDC050202 TaxID=3155035 RepID=UPI003409B301
MGIASRIQETLYRATGRTELAEVVRDKRAAMAMVSHLQESIADLEARMYEPGWQKLTAMAAWRTSWAKPSLTTPATIAA